MNKTVLKKSLGVSAVFAAGFLMVVGLVLADNAPDFTYEITDGVLAVDIVDGTGVSVTDPVVDFGSGAFSSDVQNTDGVLGGVLGMVEGVQTEIADARIRAYNPTAATTWSVNIAPASAFAWESGPDSYPIDSANADDGLMTITPSIANLSSDVGCSLDSLAVSIVGVPFSAETRSIDLVIAFNGAPYCRWDLSGTQIDQVIPAAQPVGSYSIPMVLTISAGE